MNGNDHDRGAADASASVVRQESHVDAGRDRSSLTPSNRPRITLSVVSHGQSQLVARLLDDLRRLSPTDIEVIVTLNLPEDESFLKAAGATRLKVIRNATPMGFGANHNQAFAHATGDFFCIVNPDIRLPDAGFTTLLLMFDDAAVAGCAPLVVGPDGEVQDSARRFPSISRILRRVVLRQRKPDYASTTTAEVDWTAGMFVVFRSDAFAWIGGFDEHYFMYLEDADICRRLRDAGWKIMFQPEATVVHEARRASHRNPRHLRWHLRSMARFLTGI